MTTKYGNAPLDKPLYFFTSVEAQKAFEEADPQVRKVATHLLEACIKKSMIELERDWIRKEFEMIWEKIDKIEASQ